MIDPWQQFATWYAAAQEQEPVLPDACALATAELDDSGGVRPDVRMVLLKGFDARGFVFHTNSNSAKGRQLQQVPRAALDFHWKSLARQVRAQGAVTPVGSAESDAYFAGRPRLSQLSAWASQQSQVLPSRELFDRQMQEMADRFPDVVPRPPHWGGYRLLPDWIEFWQERPGRQHLRERFTRAGDGWDCVLLYP